MSAHKNVAIILAAGAAKRMGEAKQLLKYKGKSLLEWSIEKALSLEIPVVMVLGANAEHIKSNIDTGKVYISINKDWDRGMSTSIGCGLESALKLVPAASGVLLMLADQPAITKDHLKVLLYAGTSGDKMVATEYEESLGVPAYFPGRYFKDLMNLSGDQGAKSLFGKSAEVTEIPFEAAALDIDTQQDWLNFIQGNSDIDNSGN